MASGRTDRGSCWRHGGSQCAGTVLGGDYIGSNRISRLISPTVTLPDSFYDGEIYVGFWQWYEYSSDAYGGLVEISAYDEGTDTWSAWEPLSPGYINGTVEDWQYTYLDITDYVGLKVRFAFFHNPVNLNAAGWYIDDVGIFLPCQANTNSDGDIDGSDLAMLAQEFGVCESACQSDVEPNDWVDEADLSALAKGFGKNTLYLCPIIK